MSLTILSGPNNIDWQRLVGNLEENFDTSLHRTIVGLCNQSVEASLQENEVISIKIALLLQDFLESHSSYYLIDDALLYKLDAFAKLPNARFILFLASPSSVIQKLLSEGSAKPEDIHTALDEWRVQVEIIYSFFLRNSAKVSYFDVNDVLKNQDLYIGELSRLLGRKIEPSVLGETVFNSNSSQVLAAEIILRDRLGLLDLYDEVRASATLFGDFEPTFAVSDKRLVDLALMASIPELENDKSQLGEAESGTENSAEFYAPQDEIQLLREYIELGKVQIRELQDEVHDYYTRFVGGTVGDKLPDLSSVAIIDSSHTEQKNHPTRTALHLTARDIKNSPDFYPLEHGGKGSDFRWTGPGNTTCFRFFVDRREVLDLKICVVAIIKPPYLKALQILIDEKHISHKVRRTGKGLQLSCSLPTKSDGKETAVCIRLPSTHSPKELGVGEDYRVLGLAISDIFISSRKGLLAQLSGKQNRDPSLT